MNDAANPNLLSTTLDYAALGWLVFPCKPGAKVPAFSGGFKNATGNPATVRRYFGSSTPYNIGIATGVASGVFVLDVDGAIGAAALVSLEAVHGELPPTRTSVTARGLHLWFRCVDELRSSAGKIGRGLDIRADGGYALAPPSRHPDGPLYRWSNSLPPALPPAWLIRFAQHRPALQGPVKPIPPIRRVNATSAYGAVALEREIKALASTAPGGRNHALNRASFSLHQLVAGGELEDAEVRHRLLEAAIANGLVKDDGARAVLATITSGARAGMKHPRGRT